mmetsp:Transcript_31307/g.72982  ORF Transcript_31307/g.72982 Transcript_31307/m.72982 type:complete len:301 (-) Transcript_31307:126-1028(-)
MRERALPLALLKMLLGSLEQLAEAHHRDRLPLPPLHSRPVDALVRGGGDGPRKVRPSLRKLPCHRDLLGPLGELRRAPDTRVGRLVRDAIAPHMSVEVISDLAQFVMVVHPVCGAELKHGVVVVLALTQTKGAGGGLLFLVEQANLHRCDQAGVGFLEGLSKGFPVRLVRLFLPPRLLLGLLLGPQARLQLRCLGGGLGLVRKPLFVVLIYVAERLLEPLLGLRVKPWSQQRPADVSCCLQVAVLCPVLSGTLRVGTRSPQLFNIRHIVWNVAFQGLSDEPRNGNNLRGLQVVFRDEGSC